MQKNLILIFTRNPELGKVKTRLAKTIGNEKALEVYILLLQKTKEITQGLNCDKAVYYSVKVRENDIWDENIYQKHQQNGDDLGIRMQNAFLNAFTNDVVMGPAEDGGYYLLGMTKNHPAIFKNKEWGTSTVRKDTLNDLKDSKVHLLEELNDIDLYEDLKKHDSLLKII